MIDKSTTSLGRIMFNMFTRFSNNWRKKYYMKKPPNVSLELDNEFIVAM